jgi:hypothetical protein
MIVVMGRHRVHTDAGFRQPAGDGDQKAPRFQRGLDVQRDQALREFMRQPCAIGFTPHNERRSLRFAKCEHRLERGGNFSIRRDGAKDEDGVVHFRLHGLQQRCEITFACHGGIPSKILQGGFSLTRHLARAAGKEKPPYALYPLSELRLRDHSTNVGDQNDSFTDVA